MDFNAALQNKPTRSTTERVGTRTKVPKDALSALSGPAVSSRSSKSSKGRTGENALGGKVSRTPKTRPAQKSSFKVYDENLGTNAPSSYPVDLQTKANSDGHGRAHVPTSILQSLAIRAQERIAARTQAEFCQEAPLAPGNFDPRRHVDPSIQSSHLDSTIASASAKPEHPPQLSASESELQMLTNVTGFKTDIESELRGPKDVISKMEWELSTMKHTFDQLKSDFSLTQRRIALLEKQNEELKETLSTIQFSSQTLPVKSPPKPHTPLRSSPLSQSSTNCSDSSDSIPSLIVTPMTPPMSVDKKADREAAFGVFSALAMRRMGEKPPPPHLFKASNSPTKSKPLAHPHHQRGVSMPSLKLGLATKDVNADAVAGGNGDGELRMRRPLSVVSLSKEFVFGRDEQI